MPTFDTPEPISVTVEIGVGDIRIVAGDRTNTVVEVRPGDSTRKGDVTAAQQTRVEYAAGKLLIKAPRSWRHVTFWGGAESIAVEIEVPAGSHVRAGAAVATLHCAGRLGECNFKISAGELRLAQAGAVRLKTATGDITVEHAVGDAEIATASGAVRLERVEGAAEVKNSNGDTRIGEITGDLRVNAANGTIVVEHALAAVSAKTANGDIRLLDVQRGTIVAQTARGKVEIGIRDGVAAWLDLVTSFGHVRNGLDNAARPLAGEESVDVTARTAFGDITVTRASAPDATRR